MTERRRALPPWMAAAGERKVKEKEPPKIRRRKRKTARAAFYCMDEAELVEAAVCCLSGEDAAPPTDHKDERKAADTTVKMGGGPGASETMAEALEEEPTDCGDAQESAYVSETDLDITEVETAPYAKSPQQRGSEGQRSGAGRGHGGPASVGLEAEKKEELSQEPADAAQEDDSLRLVREIFFT